MNIYRKSNSNCFRRPGVAHPLRGFAPLLILLLQFACFGMMRTAGAQPAVRDSAATAAHQAPPAVTAYTLAILPGNVASEGSDNSRAAGNDAGLHLHVTVSAAFPLNQSHDFAIPAWTPGYYQILHFEAGIHNVKAVDERGLPLPVAHISPRVWHVENTAGNAPNNPLTHTNSASRITLSYDVEARDEGLGFFGSALDIRNQRGYVNGASALMYPVGQTQTPCTLTLTLPTGWSAISPGSPLEPAPNTPQSTDQNAVPRIPSAPTRFQAASYDALIDCPLQCGQFETVSFEADGVTYQCVLVGRQSVNKDALADVLRKITHAAVVLFGKPPFSRYVFFYHLGGSGFYGGLEHQNSTVIHLPFLTGSAMDEEFLGTTAHEFFHAWNVKRLHPAGLGPFDYTQPVRTESLWFAEGVTDYYSQLLLVRSGLKSREWFWRDIAGRIALLDHTPARARVSLADSSRKAWEGGSEGYDGLSYYLKGSLVGLYFDLRLRTITHNRAGLDDVMRLLDAQYGAKNAGYPEEALLAALNTVAHLDMTPEYDRCIRSVDDIDWNAVLQAAGLELHRDPAPFLGVRLAEDQGSGGSGALIAVVEAGQSAAKMGMKDGDRILRIGSLPVSSDNVLNIIGALTPMQPVQLTIQRNDEVQRLAGTVGLTYTHHNINVLPTGRQTPSQKREVNALLDGLFSLVPAPQAPPLPTPLSTTNSAIGQTGVEKP